MRICVLQELSEISLLNFLITKREHLIVDVRDSCLSLFFSFQKFLYLFYFMILITGDFVKKIILTGDIADNMTEALLFLSHFMGDIHQVCLKIFKISFIIYYQIRLI